jgi:sec-independent protein translocase protein TatB
MQIMSGAPVLLFFDISGGELLIIMLVVFLVFGPEKMPEMARKAGRLMNQMKKASSDLTNEFKKETSVLQNEINAAHAKVDEQIESVRREVNRTKAQVVTEMNVESKPETVPDAVTPAEEPSSVKNDPAEPAKTETNTTKTE